MRALVRVCVSEALRLITRLWVSDHVIAINDAAAVETNARLVRDWPLVPSKTIRRTIERAREHRLRSALTAKLAADEKRSRDGPPVLLIPETLRHLFVAPKHAVGKYVARNVVRNHKSLNKLKRFHRTFRANCKNVRFKVKVVFEALNDGEMYYI